MTTTTTTSGPRIKELRMAKRMSQKDLATKTGLSLGMINQIETKGKVFSLASFYKIIDALETTKEDFFCLDKPEDIVVLNKVRTVLASDKSEIKAAFLAGLNGIIESLNREKNNPAISYNELENRLNDLHAKISRIEKLLEK